MPLFLTLNGDRDGLDLVGTAPVGLASEGRLQALLGATREALESERDRLPAASGEEWRCPRPQAGAGLHPQGRAALRVARPADPGDALVGSVAGDAVDHVDPASLQVVGAVEAAGAGPSRRAIGGPSTTPSEEILEAQRHPTLRWVGQQIRAGERLRLGLHLKGARQPADLVGVEGGARRAGDLAPSRWGIAPTALGALTPGPGRGRRPHRGGRRA